jgi:PAS domain S-box-containing protein
MNSSLAFSKNRLIFYTIILTGAIQFAWDLWTPHEVANWVGYFIPVFLAGWYGGRNYSYQVASVVTLMMLAAHYISPAGIDPQLALLSRLTGIGAFWMMAMLTALNKDAIALRLRTQRALRMISECNQILVRETAEDQLLKKICQIIVDIGGYRMAWVGFADNDGQKSVRVAAVAGADDGYLDQAKINWDENSEGGRGPAGIALRTGEIVVTNDFANDIRPPPWHRQAAQRGYAASITLPLKNAGKNFGVLVFCAGKKNVLSDNEVKLLVELANDLAFGIHSMRARAERQAAEKANEQSRLRLELSTEATGLGIWEWNVLTNKIRWDAQMFRLYGVAATADLQVDYAVWQNAVFPEDLAQQEAALQATVRRGGTGHRLFRIRRSDTGDCRWIEAVETVRRNDRGQVEWVLGTNLDITDRKQAQAALQELNATLEQRVAERAEALRISEQRMDLAFRATQDGIWDWNMETDEVFYSSRWKAMLGYKEAEIEHHVSAWKRLLHPDDLARATQVVQDVLAGKREYVMEFRMRHKDGHYVPILSRGFPIRGAPDGSIIRIVGTHFDQRERKQAEEALHQLNADLEHRVAERTAALQQREEIFSSIVSQAGDAIGLVDVETGKFTEFNHAAYELLGYTREEFNGFGLANIDTQLSPEQIQQNIGLIVHRGGAVFETKHRHRNGELRDVRVSARHIRLQGKDYITAIWSDITENHRRENELRKLSLAVEHNPSSVVITDAQGNIEYVNHRFTEVTGYALQEVRGQNPRILKSGQQPAGIYEELWREITQGRDWRGELVNRKKDGSLHTELVVISPVKNDQGVITNFVAMKEDISERKKLEENQVRLATAVEQSSETIVITDTNGVILYANPSFERTTGYTRSEAIGKNPRLLKSGKQDTLFYRDMWETLARGETWRGHFVNQRKNGSLYEEDAVISPIRNNFGTVTNYVAVKHDVTREMQLESQFRQAQKMEAIGTLAGGIAHDFNNILMAIFGYASLLKLEVADRPGCLELAEDVLKSANRAKDLVAQILTFSRQREQKREVIKLNSVIKEATKFLRSSLPVDIKAEMNFSADSPAVLADPTQIYQVVMNLATNALHSMEGKPGQLTISLDTFAPDENMRRLNPKFRAVTYARLSVADTGHGMDTHTLDRIFEPFFTTKPMGKGTGIGLSVVHGIVESHDGIITVESTPGQGTTFNLYFPAQDSEADLNESTINDMPEGQGQRVLVVDDEVALTNILERLLKLLNYQPTVCNSPIRALALFNNNPRQFDLVITDLAMPEMNGLELVRKIRTVNSRVPILLVSGFIATLDQREMKQTGISELIAKPVSPQDIAQAIKRNIKN